MQAMPKHMEKQTKFIKRLVVFSLLFTLGFLGFRLLWQYVGEFPQLHLGIFNGVFRSYFGVGMTLFLAYLAWEQLSNIAETSSAEFLLQLKKDLFTPETRTLFHLFELGWIAFKQTDEKYTAWFEINEAGIKNSQLPRDIQEQLLKKKVYSTYEIDDWVLGHLEDVGLLLKRDTLRIAMIYEEFSTFYALTLKSAAIQSYLRWLRLEANDFYDNLEYAAQRCKEYEQRKRKQLTP